MKDHNDQVRTFYPNTFALGVVFVILKESFKSVQICKQLLPLLLLALQLGAIVLRK